MRTTAMITGAGHAGVAMSQCLTAHAIDHVMLERGEVANSWKTQRGSATQGMLAMRFCATVGQKQARKHGDE